MSGKAVLISINSKWCRKIVLGEKTIEIRKTKPKLKTPLKCYIYQTLPKRGERYESDGRVIGEFVCDDIFNFSTKIYLGDKQTVSDEDIVKYSCVLRQELRKYEGNAFGLYGWHISNLVIYDQPKPLSDFSFVCDRAGCKGCKRQVFRDLGDGHTGYKCDRTVKRAPQSWCFVEELT